jgi:catechol 2,3-dioxygenase-like lactoylglutathione lyase family enzyme
MAVELNHTIVWCRDQQKSASFLAEILDRPAPVRFGPFLVVELDNGASLDFYQKDGKPALQHYAFLIGDAEFDAVFAKVEQRGLPYWADPAKEKPDEINTHYGGRGFYFDDPDGHLLEVITTPYGSEMP